MFNRKPWHEHIDDYQNRRLCSVGDDGYGDDGGDSGGGDSGGDGGAAADTGGEGFGGSTAGESYDDDMSFDDDMGHDEDAGSDIDAEAAASDAANEQYSWDFNETTGEYNYADDDAALGPGDWENLNQVGTGQYTWNKDTQTLDFNPNVSPTTGMPWAIDSFGNQYRGGTQFNYNTFGDTVTMFSDLHPGTKSGTVTSSGTKGVQSDQVSGLVHGPQGPKDDDEDPDDNLIGSSGSDKMSGALSSPTAGMSAIDAFNYNINNNVTHWDSGSVWASNEPGSTWSPSATAGPEAGVLAGGTAEERGDDPGFSWSWGQIGKEDEDGNITYPGGLDEATEFQVGDKDHTDLGYNYAADIASGQSDFGSEDFSIGDKGAPGWKGRVVDELGRQEHTKDLSKTALHAIVDSVYVNNMMQSKLGEKVGARITAQDDRSAIANFLVGGPGSSKHGTYSEEDQANINMMGKGTAAEMAAQINAVVGAVGTGATGGDLFGMAPGGMNSSGPKEGAVFTSPGLGIDNEVTELGTVPGVLGSPIASIAGTAASLGGKDMIAAGIAGGRTLAGLYSADSPADVVQAMLTGVSMVAPGSDFANVTGAINLGITGARNVETVGEGIKQVGDVVAEYVNTDLGKAINTGLDPIGEIIANNEFTRAISDMDEPFAPAPGKEATEYPETFGEQIVSGNIFNQSDQSIDTSTFPGSVQVSSNTTSNNQGSTDETENWADDGGGGDYVYPSTPVITSEPPSISTATPLMETQVAQNMPLSYTSFGRRPGRDMPYGVINPFMGVTDELDALSIGSTYGSPRAGRMKTARV